MLMFNVKWSAVLDHGLSDEVGHPEQQLEDVHVNEHCASEVVIVSLPLCFDRVRL
jgi:hypothetical protein